MSILSPTNMGNVIDLSGYLQARQNRLTTNATDIANTLKAFENARDVINRRNLFNPIKGQLEEANAYKQKLAEAEGLKGQIGKFEADNTSTTEGTPAYTNPYKGYTKANTPEEIKALQQEMVNEGIIPATYKGKDGKEHSNVDGIWGTTTENGLKTYLEKHPDTAEVKGETFVNWGGADVAEREAYDKNKEKLAELQKYLDENKSKYDDFNKNYGWINDPSFNFANEEYIRTGNSSLLSNLKNQWATQQLQKAQIEKENATKLEEKQKQAREGELEQAKAIMRGIIASVENDSTIKDSDKFNTVMDKFKNDAKLKAMNLTDTEIAKLYNSISDYNALQSKSVKAVGEEAKEEKKKKNKTAEDAKLAQAWEEHVKKGDVGIMGYFGNDKATYIKNRGKYNGKQY